MPAFWGVVRSLPKREAFAAERLRMDHGFEVFLPLVQTQRASAPLFAGYFFCRIFDRWRSINSTFGVLCLVRTGDCPARCPDHEIDRLRAMIDGHGFVRLPGAPATPAGRKITVGAKVRITAGPFGGMSGLYAGQSTRERELVLLNVLGGQRPVSIAGNLVVPQRHVDDPGGAYPAARRDRPDAGLAGQHPRASGPMARAEAQRARSSPPVPAPTPAAAPTPHSTALKPRERHDNPAHARAAERKLLAAMRERPGLSASLAKIVGAGVSATKERLRRMGAQELIEKAPDGRWQVKAEEPRTTEDAARPTIASPS